MTEKWILRIVENAGEMLAKESDDAVSVPKEPLREDMKHHLSFVPKNYLWTIGWRTYVWQEKETGKYKDLTEEEWHDAFIGTLGNSRADSTDAGTSTDSEGNEGDATE